MGFNRKGYKNDNFPVLIAKLQKVYGKDYVITHYVGAQYPVCEPVIEALSLTEILEERNRKKVTGISTLYIPPKDDGQVGHACLGYSVRSSQVGRACLGCSVR